MLRLHSLDIEMIKFVAESDTLITVSVLHL